MNDKVSLQLEENADLRNQVMSIMESIRTCIEDISPMSSLQETELGLNNILDDLPFQQQISLYQDSIFELKKQLKYKQVLEIDHLENEIKAKMESKYDLKNQHECLFKLIKEQNNIISDHPQSETQYQIQLKSNKVKEARMAFKEQKLIQNALLETIKKQNNAIYTLEDNCMFIKENIEYKMKLSDLEQEDPLLCSFEDLDGKTKQIELLAHKQEEYYKTLLMKQQKAVEAISDEINDLTCKLNEVNKELKLSELKLKQSQKKSFYNTNATSNNNHNDKIEEVDFDDDNALLTSNLKSFKSLCNTQKLFDRIDKSILMNYIDLD